MYVDLSYKEMAVLAVIMDGVNSRSKYWEAFEYTLPIIMEEQGIKHQSEGAAICDNLQEKLKVWINQ